MKFFLVKLMYIGRFDVTETQFMCSNCHTVSKPVLEKNNMWHGDPTGKSAYIFSQELFVFYDLLRKNLPGISEYGFLHTLEQFSKLKGRVRLYNNIQLIML